MNWICNKYFVNTHSVPGTVPDTGDTEVNKTSTHPYRIYNEDNTQVVLNAGWEDRGWGDVAKTICQRSRLSRNLYEVTKPCNSLKEESPSYREQRMHRPQGSSNVACVTHSMEKCGQSRTYQRESGGCWVWERSQGLTCRVLISYG